MYNCKRLVDGYFEKIFKLKNNYFLNLLLLWYLIKSIHFYDKVLF